MDRICSAINKNKVRFYRRAFNLGKNVSPKLPLKNYRFIKH